MKIGSSRLCAIVAASVCMLCAGAGNAQSGAEQRAPQLRIYAFSEIAMNRYDVVARLWADSWRSAFWVPTFPSREQAVAALQTEAARLGADALVNVDCFDQGRWKWSTNTEPAFYCYGMAVRVRQSPG